MQLLTDLVSNQMNKTLSEDFFIHRIKPLVGKVDWSSNGEFASANGRKGANEVYLAIKQKLAQ